MKNKLTFKEAYRLYIAKHRLNWSMLCFGFMMLVIACNGLGRLIGMKYIYVTTIVTGLIYVAHIGFYTWQIMRDFNLTIKDK